jgi:hypothetical protein
MTKIYEQHDSAFSRVSAYVVARNGERVATIAFKFPADGAGRLWAYVHWLGLEMVRGYAGGYGYDKRTAACSSAMGPLKAKASAPGELEILRNESALAAFIEALARDAGQHWGGALRDAGFEVWQAV